MLSPEIIEDKEQINGQTSSAESIIDVETIEPDPPQKRIHANEPDQREYPPHQQI